MATAKLIDGVWEYEAHGKDKTNDGVLTNVIDWDTGNTQPAYTSGSFGPGGTFKDGTIFKGVSFTNFVKFGNGCIFEDCTFNYNMKNPYSTFGSGCVFSNCTLNGVTIPKDNVLANCKIGTASVQATTIDTPAKQYDLPAVHIERDVRVGTRIDSNNQDVSFTTGVNGYADKRNLSTSGTENTKPQI